MPLRIPVGLKRAIAKVICHPTVGRTLAWLLRDRIATNGLVIDTSSVLVAPEVKAALFWRMYESAEIRFVNRYLRSDLDVVELGSSLGVIACAIRRRIKSNCKLICVEGRPELVESTTLNIRINKLDKNVVVLAKAIDYDRSHRETVSFEASTTSLRGRIADPGLSGTRTKTTTLGRIVSESGLGDYVLVSDVEGAEAGIVFRDREALQHCKQMIIELHDTIFDGATVDVERMLEMLTQTHGFRLRDSYGPVCVFEKD